MARTVFSNGCCLLIALSVGLLFQSVKQPAAFAQIKPKSLDVEDARKALDQMIESKAFLSDVPILNTLKKRILAENKSQPIMKASTSSSNPGGFFIGSWNYYPGTDEFAYITKSADRNELFTIRGQFLLGSDNRWTAKINEASVTKLTNFFGKAEYDKIQKGLNFDEVITILGSPPGAYFAAEMGFGYPDGLRWNYPFTGTSKEFHKDHTRFFVPKPNVNRNGTITRGWISNDLAIWVVFDDDYKVFQTHCSEVRCPNDCHTHLRMEMRKLFEQLNKKELPKGK